MAADSTTPRNDFVEKLKWLMFARVLVTSFLLGSTIVLHTGKTLTPLDTPLLVLYGMIAGVFLLSFIYAVLLNRLRRLLPFAYLQITVDTVVVTLVIFVTGSFSSIFSFLYLVVIIYSSLFLFRSGSLLIAAISTIQYGTMVNLEYYGVLNPVSMEGFSPAYLYPWSHVLYKVMIIIAACFAVAYLSNLLSEQVRKTKIKLEEMEGHVKRVEKMAYMGKMAANMAHEIKNPLASLTGSIQMLREDLPYDPNHDKLMQIVLRETGRLSELVNNFLLFARPTKGKMETLELDKALNDTIRLFEKSDKCRDLISIQNDFAPGIRVEMDPIHLRQVLWNLLLNASEAIDGAGTISIKTFQADGEFVTIEIADSGCGMSRELIQSIFDPFFTTKANGTGLGLSIVHSILESYGSRMSVDSRPGAGATFSLRLKVKFQESDA